MLSPELQKNIDEKWDSCWPLSLLRPVAILDLISYLFFLKKISENKLTQDAGNKNSDTGFSQSKEDERIESDIIKNLEAESMHVLFSSEKGNIDLVKNYARSLAYGQYVKGGLLVTPTQKLLVNAVDIIKIIEDATDDTKEEILEYLLNKKELSGPNGQAYLPEYLVNLIVSIVQPNEKDLILDISVGNGALLTCCAKYIAGLYPKPNNPAPRKLTGLESDLTSLRIAGMNMILHRINNPELKALDAFGGFGSVTIDQPTVMLANLIFSSGDSKTITESASLNETTRKEILYLNFILKQANPGTRVAVIVPDNILYNNAPEFVQIRQKILDQYTVQAVISLNDKSVSQFFGTSILIFFKEVAAITDKVWFYKMEHCKEEKIDSKNNRQSSTEKILNQRDELEGIINHFENKAESTNPDSFYIEVKDIRAKNYSLSYNEYNLLIENVKTIHLSEIPVAEKNKAIANLKNKTQFPAAEKLPKPKKSYVKKIILFTILSIVILGMGFGAYWTLYLKKDFFKLFDFQNHTSAIKDTAESATTADTSNISDTVKLINTNRNKKISENGNTVNAKKYTVATERAYFYTSPDTSTRRELYLVSAVNAVLTPEKETNGFIYVVYVNKRGQSTRGWLNKKDLKPLP